VTSLRARRSRVWSLAFRASYRLLRLLDPLIRSWMANGAPGLDGIVELRTVGRRSGRPRRTLVTLLNVGERFYVGHPNGMAEWLANIVAAGWVDVDPPGAGGPRYSVHRLPAGAERDAVVRATWTQQPFPANLLYRVARRHVAAVGEYIRLTPTRSEGPLPVTAPVH
jgi:deazaflavin-dependent oxidoreductase (nitroreductase family)